MAVDGYSLLAIIIRRILSEEVEDDEESRATLHAGVWEYGAASVYSLLNSRTELACWPKVAIGLVARARARPGLPFGPGTSTRHARSPASKRRGKEHSTRVHSTKQPNPPETHQVFVFENTQIDADHLHIPPRKVSLQSPHSAPWIIR
jgi:hypothetical protein